MIEQEEQQKIYSREVAQMLFRYADLLGAMAMIAGAMVVEDKRLELERDEKYARHVAARLWDAKTVIEA